MEFNKQTSTVRSSASEAIIDQGLRSYMLKVYNYMASGVLLTGFIALAFFKMAVVTSKRRTDHWFNKLWKYNLRFGT